MESERKVPDLSASLSSVRYDVILADPPWQYDHDIKGGEVERHYKTMRLEDVCALDVPGLSHDATVLFLWATAPKLLEAMRVMEAWGFKYTTCAVWDKLRIGRGYYFRGQHELLLVGKRKKTLCPRVPNRWPTSVLQEKRGQHSKKPTVAYEAIEFMYPEARRIELFARERRVGWDAWGDELVTDQRATARENAEG